MHLKLLWESERVQNLVNHSVETFTAAGGRRLRERVDMTLTVKHSYDIPCSFLHTVFGTRLHTRRCRRRRPSEWVIEFLCCTKVCEVFTFWKEIHFVVPNYIKDALMESAGLCLEFGTSQSSVWGYCGASEDIRARAIPQWRQVLGT